MAFIILNRNIGFWYDFISILTHIFTYTHTDTNADIYIYIYIYIRAYIHARTRTHAHTHAQNEIEGGGEKKTLKINESLLNNVVSN